MAIIIFAVIYFGIKLIKNYAEDCDMREFSRKNGLDFYASTTGLRSTKSNKKVYFDNEKMKEF